MKIIKQGNLTRLSRPVYFICETCGCEFEAIKGEYIHRTSARNEEWYEAKCPCCHQIVFVDV